MKSRKFHVGGITEIYGKWHGFFEIHCPCDGTTKHRNCVVTEKRISKAYDTREEAVAIIYEVKESSGILGWEVIGPKA